MLKIGEIRDIIIELGVKIGLEKESELFPMFTEQGRVFSDGNSVYVTETEYHYVVMERGKVNECYRGEHLDDILYPVFNDITFTLAMEYEIEHRNNDVDSRKERWRKQLELLEAIDIKFVETRKKEIEEILKKYPFRQ